MFTIPKVSYSLLASVGKFGTLAEALSAVSEIGIDMIHFDVSEEPGSLALEDLEDLRRHTPLPFDVHLWVKDPAGRIAGVRMRADDYFCVHVENRCSLEELMAFKSRLGCRFGLAINVETPASALEYAVPALDFVLFMAATPGVSGGSFNEAVVEKIQEFKARHPGVKIHVDGGINVLSAALLRDLGIHALISGSYLLRDSNYANQVGRLVGQNLNLPVTAMMHAGAGMPSVPDSASVSEAAREIDAKSIGCTCVLDARGRFAGLITDTDIRRFVMSHDSLRGVTAREIMNPGPYVVGPDRSLIMLLRELQDRGVFFTVVPVVGADGACLGILRLQDVLFRNALGLRIRHI